MLASLIGFLSRAPEPPACFLIARRIRDWRIACLSSSIHISSFNTSVRKDVSRSPTCLLFFNHSRGMTRPYARRRPIANRACLQDSSCHPRSALFNTPNLFLGCRFQSSRAKPSDAADACLAWMLDAHRPVSIHDVVAGVRAH
jgi:hypothetical protein